MLVARVGIKNTSRLLDKVSSIHYLVYFKKNKIRALINSCSKVNIKILVYAAQLTLKAQKTNVSAQKIDGSILQRFEMVLRSFWVKDKSEKAHFFQEIFLLADTSVEMFFEIFFLTFSNVDI